MSIEITCQQCDKSCRIDDRYAGKRIRCPDCSEVLDVPTLATGRSQRSSSKPPAASRKPSKPPEAKAIKSSRSSRRQREPDAEPPPSRRSTRSSGTRQKPKPKPKTKSNSDRSPLMIPMAIGGGVLALALVGFMAFKLGQSDNQPANIDVAAGDNSNQVASMDPAASVAPDSATNTVSPDAQSDVQSSVEPEPTTPAVAVATNQASRPAVAPAAAPFIPPAYAGNTPASAGSSTPDNTTSADNMAGSPGSNSAPATDVERSLPELIALIEPSVVRIDVRTAEGLGNGSGFIVDDKGTVVTNYHVIAGGQNATATLSDKTKVRVLGYTYADPKRDIAILKIDVSGAGKFPSLKLIDVPPLKGQAVVAMGAPFGLDSTASEGIVSGSRTAQELEDTLGITDHAGTWIQTTTPISPGNSGGPLVNRKGKVVAINTMTLTIGQNLNFGISAMDINDALTKQSSAARQLSPVAVPELASSGSGKPKVVDIVGTPQAEKFFGRVKRVRIIMLAFAADPRGVVVNSVRNEAIKAIETADLRLGGDDADVLMMVGMSLTGSGGAAGAQQLRVTTQLLYQDETSASPKVYKIWDSTGPLGTLSLQSLVNGVLPRRMSSEVKTHFRELRSAFKRAQAKAKKEPSL